MKSQFRRRLGSGLERLEDRRLTAVDINLSADGVLSIAGDDLRNEVRIEQIDMTIGTGPHIRDRLEVAVKGQGSFFFKSSAVKSINADLRGGDDSFWYGLGPNSQNTVGGGNKQAYIQLGAGADECVLEFRGLGTGPLFGFGAAVDAGPGNDKFVGNFTGSNFPGANNDQLLNVSARMGLGDDTASLNLWRDLNESTATGITMGSIVNLLLYGDGGNDTLTTWNAYDMSADGLLASRFNNLDISPRSKLGIYMHGGAGDDTLAALYSGRVDGALTVYMNGDAGQDHVEARLNVQPQSRGAIDAQIFGGADNDDLKFLLNDYSFKKAKINRAVVDGGLGTDRTLGSTSNVSRMSIELLPFAPKPPGQGTATSIGGGTVIG
jgi:hypothetical protein